MPRLLGVLRGRRSWQGHVGWSWRPPTQYRLRRELFAVCTAASAPFLPWRRREHTHAGFLRSHRPTGGLSRASSSKPCACWCSSDAPYEHQPPVPIAHFGGRLHVTTCEPCDVPGVLPGVIGTERFRIWAVCSYARAGTLLPAPPSRGMGVFASLPWLGIVLSHKILWLRFSQGVFRVSGKAL